MDKHGVVVSRYRKHTSVEDENGLAVLCQSSRRLRPLVGDRVDFELQRDGSGLLKAIQPRQTVLTRVAANGSQEVVAANLTQLIVVIAPEPAVDWWLLDRYLTAAELMPVKAHILFNKMDLVDAPPPTLHDYEEIGYNAQGTSTVDGTGLGVLEQLLSGEVSALVGQSGVGKSSLINALLGEPVLTTRRLSRKGKHGRHTTTTSTLHRLAKGGALIDSPGVRDYAPYIDDERLVDRGYREFRPWLGQCRFADCQHLAEPGCAIKDATTAGHILKRRYESYVRLHALVAALRAKREG
jgi:ribosome biogenesis GTPase